MHSPESNAVDVNLEQLVQVQRSAFLAEGPASLRTRRDRLARALDLLVSHEAELCEAIAADFGQRPVSLTRVMDIFPAVHALRYARRHVGGWMRSRARRLGFPNLIPGVTGEILYQPLGVVGVISPWNFPVTLSFGPLAGILAAGNRCLVKPSELGQAGSLESAHPGESLRDDAADVVLLERGLGPAAELERHAVVGARQHEVGMQLHRPFAERDGLVEFASPDPDVDFGNSGERLERVGGEAAVG